MYRKNAWENLAEDEKEQLSAFAKDYMAFLNNGKTERECVAEGVRQAEAKGFKNLMDVVKNGETLKAGDRVYRAWMNKDIMLFIIGEKPMECGMNILGAHIDSPRIDIKQNPLYEDEHLAYLDTHYYGGIKKYQWTAVPLALHGTGDVFASAFCGKLMADPQRDMQLALAAAADFCYGCVRETVKRQPSHWYGLSFEDMLKKGALR